MTTPPPATPYITPVDDPIVATETVLLLHVPPEVALDKDADALWQILLGPVIAPGTAFTVMGLVAAQPVGSV
jgi:hypothetical protein